MRQPIQTCGTSRARASTGVLPPLSRPNIHPLYSPTRSRITIASASITSAATAVTVPHAQSHARALKALPKQALLTDSTRAVTSLRSAMSEVQNLLLQIKSIKDLMDRQDNQSIGRRYSTSTGRDIRFTSTSTTKPGGREFPWVKSSASKPTDRQRHSFGTPSRRQRGIHNSPLSLGATSPVRYSTPRKLEPALVSCRRARSLLNSEPRDPRAQQRSIATRFQHRRRFSLDSNAKSVISETGRNFDVVDEDPISRKRKRYAGFWDEVVENIELFIHAPSESESPIFLTRVTPCIRRRRKSSVSRKSRAANLPRKNKKFVHGVKSEGDAEDRSRKRSKCSTKPMVVPEDQTLGLDESFFVA